MKIIKTDVKTYLREHLKLREDVDIPTIENDYQLDRFINTFVNTEDSSPVWSYSIEELDYLLDREKDNQVEETFVLMFEELWEVPSDE